MGKSILSHKSTLKKTKEINGDKLNIHQALLMFNEIHGDESIKMMVNTHKMLLRDHTELLNMILHPPWNSWLKVLLGSSS